MGASSGSTPRSDKIKMLAPASTAAGGAAEQIIHRLGQAGFAAAGLEEDRAA